MKLELHQALFWCEQLAAVAILLQSIELIFLRRKIMEIWQKDLLPSQFLRISGCIGLFISPDPLFHLSILAGTLISSKQLRGTFNGGSDIMTFHVLLAVTLARLFPSAEFMAQIALGYLALQLVLSYFISGLVKVRKKSWREGSALKNIVTAQFYDVPHSIRSKNISWKHLGWATMLFELLFPLALVNTTVAVIMITIALIFHLGNFVVLGLNRFVFAWLAAYPALIWLSGIR